LHSQIYLIQKIVFFKKKINLGLDLQGGSYLLLEIDNEPVIEQKLQNLTSTIRNYFKDKNINLNNLKLLNKSIIFDVEIDNIDTVLSSFLDENSEINPYYPRFKSHQMDVTENSGNFEITFSKQG